MLVCSFQRKGLWWILAATWLGILPSHLSAQTTTCKKGEYLNNGTCAPCPKGHYCVVDQKWSCYVGSYQDERGKEDCKLCQPGTAQSLQGQTSCVPCPANTYSKKGFSLCQPCPSSSFCLVPNLYGECNKGSTACVKGIQKCIQKSFPSKEVCDSKDNNCDGVIDENLTRECFETNSHGSCKGSQRCDLGSWLPCNARSAVPEICDGADNDCDGQIDENLSRSCSKGSSYGFCTGMETCKSGQWVGCNAPTPVKEICNNKDDNCNGTIDETLSRGCSVGTGGSSCAGLQTCSKGVWSKCTAGPPLPETCNGSDDDCDGKIDEGLTRPCKQTNPDGTCTGKEVCNNGLWGACDARIPTFETCNGVDDNCNGKTDENLRRQCFVDNAYGSCAGNKDCKGGKWTKCDARTPQKESCNGKDDDCDGSVDEYEDGPCDGFKVCVKQKCVECATDKECRTLGKPACYKNKCEICATNKHCPKGTVCHKNQCVECGTNNDCPAARPNCVDQRCYACADKRPPGVEICDGRDNNCDGQTDENLSRPCVLKTDKGQCNGRETCDNGKWGVCSAPKASVELCNGKDDDCDGRTDNQPNSYRVLLRDCKGPCGKKGLEFCVEGRWKGCTGIQECKEPIEPEPLQEKKTERTKERVVPEEPITTYPDLPGGLDLRTPNVGCQCSPPTTPGNSFFLWMLLCFGLLGWKRRNR